MKVKIKFLYHKKAKDLFALFVDKEEMPGYFACYSLVGQHSLCQKEYAQNSIEAFPEQYEELKNELLNLDYDIEIVNSNCNENLSL